MKKLIIRNPDECVAATKRVQALSGAASGSEQERELKALSDAIKVYEDSIAMMRGVGRKASEQPEEGVSDTTGQE
ncbi:hypothetical protein FQV39_18045 [Bosea sp. F3-2]|uniref:hypothetical protein n=1 Tax=Bosea sp. F3-2 TaxID=2599640 RepID=UPI0011EDC5B6|nr:hypothetical protein [Bosea sp. F3-2]QEL24268.1 hypothetical protein FQV39_18045 [Bosea sp. F3-2]